MENQSASDKQVRVRSRWRRLARWMLALLLLYALGSFVGSYLLLAPPRRVSSGSLDNAGSAEDKGAWGEIQRARLPVEEGLQVPLWWAAPSSEPEGCVLLFHARGGVHAVDRMRFVLANGHAVVALDFRAHGQAPGDSTGFGYTEQAEVRAALRWARDRWPDARVVAWGWSMGAAAILFAGDQTRDLAGVILESPYSSLERAFRNRFEMHFPLWLYPLCRGPVLFAEIRSGLWLDQIQPVRELPQFRADRVLLVQGALDRRVQRDEYEEFRSALPGITGVVLDGLGHEDFFRSAGKAYRSTIQGHLSRWLDE